jgi:hypothetical protein
MGFGLLRFVKQGFHNIIINFLQEKCEIELKRNAYNSHVGSSVGSTAISGYTGSNGGSADVSNHVVSNGDSTAVSSHVGSHVGSSRDPVRHDLSMYTVSTQLSDTSTQEKAPRSGR